MPFTGKATYSAGATLPEIAEDVSDLVSINSPHETPLLDALGDPARYARSTVHEWLEDTLLPNASTISVVVSGTVMTVAHVDRFRVGDQVMKPEAAERMLVTAVNTGSSQLTLARNYGGTTTATLAAGDTLLIIGNAALEGDDASAARFTGRTRRANFTQIFSKTVEVSGSDLAVKQLGVRDELDYQKSQRLRELMRDLESSVVCGVAPASNPEGSATVRRTMRGILGHLTSNVFQPASGGMPEDTYLTEESLNFALRKMWEASGSAVDLIVVNGREKRRINQFVAANRRFYSANETFKDHVSMYESDFGVCRIVLCRSVPTGTVMLLDSNRIDVLPLAGRSFHYKPLASTGDRESGQLIGEYTVEVRNESSHGTIRGLSE
jgi:hypothetical protein